MFREQRIPYKMYSLWWFFTSIVQFPRMLRDPSRFSFTRGIDSLGNQVLTGPIGQKRPEAHDLKKQL